MPVVSHPLPSLRLRVEEVIAALKELGGEAEWSDIETRVTEKRSHPYERYKDRRNYEKTMFQLVQQHCEGYRKFTGPVHFVKVKKGRFRLAPSPSLAVRTLKPPEEVYPETTVPVNREYTAGTVRQVLVNAYERDPNARKACLDQHGTQCAVCAMSFEQLYGPIGKGFIHVHHKRPLSTGEVYRLDPVKDLIPICPNCHAMLHRYDPPLPVEELKESMRGGYAKTAPQEGPNRQHE